MDRAHLALYLGQTANVVLVMLGVFMLRAVEEHKRAKIFYPLSLLGTVLYASIVFRLNYPQYDFYRRLIVLGGSIFVAGVFLRLFYLIKLRRDQLAKKGLDTYGNQLTRPRKKKKENV